MQVSTDDRHRLPDLGKVEIVRLSSLAQIRGAIGIWEALLDGDPLASRYQSPQGFFAW